MYYEHKDLSQKRTQNQGYTSPHLQVDQLRKSFTTHIVSLNSYDLLLVVLVYMQQQQNCCHKT